MFAVFAGSANAGIPTPSAGAAFSANEDSVVTFTGTPNNPDADAIVQGWVFEGGVVVANPATHTFATPGVYTATYWVFDATDPVNATSTVVVTINDITPPTANAGANQNVNEDTVVNLDASNSTDNDPNFATTGKYYWTFSDQGVSRSLTGKTTTYTFNTPGVYSVNLLVLDAAGNFASAIMTVTAKDVTAPTGSGSVPASNNEDSPVSFSSASITDNDPSFGANRRDYWTFTDGAAKNLSGTGPSYTFNTPGSFAITLTVMDATGNKLTQAFTINIIDITAPTGSGTVPASNNEDSAVSFSSAAITDNDPTFAGNRRDYWTFTDPAPGPGAVNRSGTSVSYTFNTPGTFTITLLVMDNTGNRLSQTFTIVINDITPPTGVGTIPATSVEDVAVAFSSAAITDNDPTFSVNRRDYWTFTDPSPGPGAVNRSGTSASYTFNTPGTFTITLLVMDNTGNRLSQTFTVVITDVTAPVPTIAAGSLAQSRERFTTFSHSGSAVDNVGVVAYWWLFTDGSAQNVSGTTLTRQWVNTGVFTITFYARDAAFNIGSTSTTFTVTPDATAPTITFTAAPLTGDDQTPLTYTATASDNDPACAASCNWTWSKDGVASAFTPLTTTITWAPGQHTLTLAVRDPTGNTRTATQTVNIDQLVQSDLLWDSLTVTMNWNLRIVNGATFLIRNSTVFNASTPPGITIAINVANGRLILENSQLVSTSATIGFKIQATGVNGAGSFLYFNGSTVSGLFDWIRVTNATLSAKDSTFKTIRVGGIGAILGTNANVYLTNVTIDASTVSTNGGISLSYTNLVTLFQSREVIIESLNARLVPRTPFQVVGTGVTGTVNVTLRNSVLRSTSPLSATHAIDLAMTSSTGVFNYKFQGVDASANTFGGLFAVHTSFTGWVYYNITDSSFNSALSSNGMYFDWAASSCQYALNLNNVTSDLAGQRGLVIRFETSGWNQGNMAFTQVDFSNNTLDGLYLYQYGVRVSSNVTMQNALFQNNRQNGIFLDTYYATSTNRTMALANATITGNALRGIYFNEYYTSYNFSLSLTDSHVDTNTQDGLYWYHYNTDRTKGNERGDHWLNLTRATFNSNLRGMYFQAWYGVNENLTGYWTDVQINNNQQQGVYSYNYLYYYYFYDSSTGYYRDGERNFTVYGERVSIARNGADGFYAYDAYAYGYLGYACLPACNNYQFSVSTEYDLYFNNSHIDTNGGKGFYWYGYYGFYSAMIWHLWLTGGSTVTNNAASGVYMYGYYLYSYAWIYQAFGRSAPEVTLNVKDSNIDANGFRGSDNYGIYRYLYYYLGGGQTLINVSNSSVSGNSGTGIYGYMYYDEYSQPANLRVDASNISNNGGRGIDNAYYYFYQESVTEFVNNTTFVNNHAEAIMHGYPQGYGREFAPWTIVYTNNRFDQIPSAAIATQVTYSCAGCTPYGGAENFNFSGNRITHAAGAAMAFSFDPPQDSQSIDVVIQNNYVADDEEGINVAIPGSTNNQHRWSVTNNTVERVNGNAMLLAMTNRGSGNSGTLKFESNVFRNTGGTAFTLVQSNIKMATLVIKDCVFNTQRTGIQLNGILGIIDNATFVASVKEDVVLTDGIVDIHNTVVDPAKLQPIGNGAAFNVWFHLKVYVVWAGTGKPVVGAVAQFSDATGNIFYVGTVADSSGLPSMELWSYTKSVQGILGHTPFKVDVIYFEIEQIASIDLYSDKTVTVEVRDNVLPTLVISNPNDGYGTQGDTIQLDGTVYDSQSGFVFDINDPQLPAQYVEVSTDNMNWTTVHVKSSSAFQVQFDYTFTGLSESVKALYVRVHDDANNYVTRVIPVRIDRTAPIVTILSPTSSSIITNKQTVTLSAETEVGALIFVNGLTPPEVFTRPDNIHAYFTMEIPVFEGPNTITVVAIDALNNQGNASVFALVDRQPPYLAVIQPDVSALVNSTTLVVSGQTERSGVTVTVNGVQATVDSQGNFSQTVTLTSDINRVEILATDLAGNTQLVVRDVRFDNVAPWINVQAPASNALLNTPEVDVVGIVEPGSRLIVNDEVVSAPTGAFTRRILLTEGANTIQFVAIDPAGNYGYRTVYVTVDTVKPTIDVTSPTNESLVNTQNAVVTGTVSDEHSPSLLVNGQEIAVNTDGSFTVAVPLFEGTNFVNLEALDGAGNSNTKVLTVISDTTAPYLLPELEGTFLDGVQVTTYNASVTVKGFAERSSVVEVCFRPAGGVNLTQVCNAIPLAVDGSFRTFVELRAGETNTISVTATDAAGNSVNRQLQVAQKAPPAIPPEPTNWGLYGLYGLGAAILGGAFFLLYLRRGKDDSRTELAGMETMPYTAQGPTDMPAAGGEMGAPVGEVQAVASPEVAGDAEVTTAPDVALDEAGPEGQAGGMTPPEGEVPAAASRARPMRRRPLGSGGEGAGEGGGLTGKGAEEEAQPGDTHQDEGDSTKEG